MVVLDFGHLLFGNYSFQKSQNESSSRNRKAPDQQSIESPDSDEEDEFFDAETDFSQEDSSSSILPIIMETSQEDSPSKDIYDHYIMTLTKLEILITKISFDWKDPKTQQNLALNFIEKFDIILNLWIKKNPVLKEYSPLLISGSLPSLNLGFFFFFFFFFFFLFFFFIFFIFPFIFKN